ncbi:hypothetical protein E1A91_A11G213600v1 [Gossypium mustelinum]|uniref:Phytosulfokine-beta n=3 Tax=Gossypium TaxID=3633 RepID=A0A2P5XQQ6_GOSBA|nr:hypothetical protein ES319_A11G208400v1 [Gossypium barbadense]PPD87012.1 hypothetical protein GOBAR_DD16050 [Gossypium barbadense]PPS05672.1 hypothetical protein GOBAR_AA14971 [Gossypium barbadense]TYG94887.1 hypothetical protein ES288_A11G224400v1 [Gossypium darwinii]TYJ10527.1 hypothetical protein E1A91_A11G213600v1 [Gossypium mustelinum]
MKFSSLVLVFLSLIWCFYMICVVHGKGETTNELLLGAVGDSVHSGEGNGGAECSKEKNKGSVDCKLQAKGGAAEETVLDEDYIYTNSLP